MQPVRLALTQMLSVPGQTTCNKETILSFLKTASTEKADIVVFPECALTGYSVLKAASYALAKDDPDIVTIRKESDRLKTAVCFGYIEKSENRLFLTQELHADGKSIFYRKTHLGTKEGSVFTAGNSFPIMKAPLSCGMQLCWESHIPEIASLERAQGAELLLVPYARPASGSILENWSIHLPARASDNGVYVAACNLLFSPDEKTTCPRGGGLAVFNPKGFCIASYEGKDDHLLFCDLKGPLPREMEADSMRYISYFDRKRTDLF